MLYCYTSPSFSSQRKTMYYLFSRTMILSNVLITQNVPGTAEILRCSHSSSENQEHAECWQRTPLFVCVGHSGRWSQRKCWLSWVWKGEKKHMTQLGKEGFPGRQQLADLRWGDSMAHMASCFYCVPERYKKFEGEFYICEPWVELLCLVLLRSISLF